MQRLPTFVIFLSIILWKSVYKIIFKNAGMLPLNPIPTWNPLCSMSLSYESNSTHNPATVILYSKSKIFTCFPKWVFIGIADLFLYRKAIRKEPFSSIATYIHNPTTSANSSSVNSEDSILVRSLHLVHDLGKDAWLYLKKSC